MFHTFSHRHTPCTIDGQQEMVILSRDSKSTSALSREFLFNAVFAANSVAKYGSMLAAQGETFLIMTMRTMTGGDKYCSVIKTNVEAVVQRLTNIYGNNKTVIDRRFEDVTPRVKAHLQQVTAHMREKDIGLLPETSHILYVQGGLDIQNPDEGKKQAPDRAVVGSRTYRVSYVNRTKYIGLLEVQLTEDVR